MKNFLLALLSGALLAAGWPTYGFPILLFFGFIPLLYLIHNLTKNNTRRTGAKIFGYAYLSFFIWNIITTYWIYYSTAAGMIFAILANTLLMALVFLIYYHIAKRTHRILSVVFLASLWMCFEYLHLHWQFSWPWLNLGNGFSEYPQWIQWYEYTGSFGGTLWIWVINIMGVEVLLSFCEKRNSFQFWKKISIFLAFIILPIIISYSIAHNYDDEKNQSKTEVLILQPDIDPYAEKYNTDDQQIGLLLTQMIEKNISDSTQLIIAPETVFADGTRRSQFNHSPAYHFGEKITKKYPQASFLGGITFYEILHDKSKINPQSNYVKPDYWYNSYNSAFMISPHKKPKYYNKSKLVVGVENFPYQNILKPILGDIMLDLGGTVSKLTTQPHRSVFKYAQQIKTAPIICYESVYGEFVTDYVKNGADFLSVITNDAWWENTQGHKQHVSYARLRAIETRRDVAQSANNGTSAIINQKGDIVKSTAYNVRVVLKGNIHLNHKKTFYVKHGDYLAIFAGILTILIFIYTILYTLKKRIISS